MFPEIVPILSAEEIHQGNYDGPNGTHCLLGWCREVFPDSWDGLFKTSHPAFRALKAEVAKAEGVAYDQAYLSCFNDSSTKPNVAKVWNKAMKTLGYTVPCERPE